MGVMGPFVHAERGVLDVHGLELLLLEVLVEVVPQVVVLEAVEVGEGEHDLGDTVSVQVVGLGFDASDQTIDVALDSVFGNDVQGLGGELDW
jgi:hypothetical protein